MNITVFGASGKVGRLFVARALTEGHTVTAFVHRNNPFDENPDLHIVRGDISDAVTVGEALKGADAVVGTLGSWGTKKKNVLSSAMKTVIPAMEQQGITRVITLTGSAAMWSGDDLGVVDKINHTILSLVAPKILKDGEAHNRALELSNLDWTIIRSPIMTGSRKATYTLNNDLGWPFATVPRAAVVQSLLDQLSDTSQLHKAPVIH